MDPTERDAGIRRLVSLQRLPSGSRCCFWSCGLARKTDPMSNLDRSAVSALVNQIDELARQVAGLADGVQGGRDDDSAGPLFEAERSLRMAGRSLDRVLRAAGE